MAKHQDARRTWQGRPLTPRNFRFGTTTGARAKLRGSTLVTQAPSNLFSTLLSHLRL